MMHRAYKLGSLFDGSGGFPLAGSLCGVEPVWAAEVEPYPIAVTRSRFPNMRHLGDISKVNGGEIEPVDIITFGSPCQDLSVAGKRAGLKHEANGDDETTRSGLFMEAVRIIKEMRKATNGEYPTFALWENVPGAFSSNRGEDFRTVLEELIKIVEPSAVMPAVPKNGWPYADSYCGDGWSLAYRVFDAQYWGVPQRRRRIHLVLDLRGERAREVLFEREGLRGHFAEGRTQWQGTAGDAANRTGEDDRAGEGFDGYNGDITGDVSATLGVNCGVSTGRNGVIERRERLDAVSGGFCPEQSAKARGIGWEEETAPTLRAGVVPGVVSAVTLEPGIAARKGGHIYENVRGTLRADAGDNRMAVAYSFDSLASNSMKSKNPHSGCRRVEIAKTLDTTDPNPSKNQGGIAIVEPVPYTLKIRSGCEGGGKGALIQEDKSATLATNNDQYLFQPMNMVLDDQGEQQITVRTDGKAPTLRAETHGNLPCVLEAAGFKAGQSMAGGIGWQIKSVIRELRRDPNSRRAIIEVRRTSDAYLDDPPCLQNIQLLIREGRLNMTALFRSNDACKATFMNAYALTCLQEKVAAELGVNVGSYTHIANSFHAYERDWKLLESYSERLMSGGELTYNFRGEWDELMEVERDDILREV